MINTKENRETLFIELSKKAVIIERLKPLLKRNGYRWTADGKLEPILTGLIWDGPWVYTKPHHFQRCDIGHRILFDHFSFIPSICRRCFKVVVRPRNIVELFDLYEIQRDIGVACKLGIEPRDTVHGLYGGYFYCVGLEEGRKRYAQIRKLVNEHLSPETPVILKRYCTEMEIGPGSFGPSNQISDLTEEQQEIERTVCALIPDVNSRGKQSDYIVAYTMKKWIMWAYKNGDETYKQLTGGNPLFPSVVTYHQEVEEDGSNS